MSQQIACEKHSLNYEVVRILDHDSSCVVCQSPARKVIDSSKILAGTTISYNESAKNALQEIKSEMRVEGENDLKWFMKSFDFMDPKFAYCRKFYVETTQDMFYSLARDLNSIEEIKAMTSSFQGGEISITINEINEKVVKVLWRCSTQTHERTSEGCSCGLKLKADSDYSLRDKQDLHFYESRSK